MAHIELVPERSADGTVVVLRGVVVGPVERVRRLLRGLLHGHA